MAEAVLQANDTKEYGMIGFVGLGTMGHAMASNIHGAGMELLVWDLDATRAASLGPEVSQASSAAEVAARASVTFFALPGPPEVRQVVFGEDGLLTAAAGGAVLVNVSTIDPQLAIEIGQQAAARGVGFVDAPVTGAADGARAGTLTVMVGADAEALEPARPALEAISERILHIGPPGHGTATKLITNMLWFIHTSALCDALLLASRFGIPPEEFGALIPQTAGASWSAHHDLPALLREDDDPSFTLALSVKDLHLIQRLAKEHRLDLDILEDVVDRFERAQDTFGEEAGQLAIRGLHGGASDSALATG